MLNASSKPATEAVNTALSHLLTDIKLMDGLLLALTK